jgi:hypothetical protein
MLVLSLGSHGDEVRRVEERLKELGLYTGAIDGTFGGGLQAAVKSFQTANRLSVDGAVGPETWAKLFPQSTPPAAAAIAGAPIAQRCLALTGAFETSTGIPDCYCGLTGNFDGQGISFGVLQWNLGQGTLQPMLTEMIRDHRDVAASIFHDDLDTLSGVLAFPVARQLQWADSIQDPHRHTVFEPWRGMFRALGRTDEYQTIQVRNADAIRRSAEAMCRRFDVFSERALALMFDILVQNGSIKPETEALIRSDYAKIPPGDPADVEVARLRAIANRRAEAARPDYVDDVRGRKLTIAEGHGTVHNVPYDLEQQFGIGLLPFAPVGVGV